MILLTTVQTVLGPVSVHELGRTLVHEHLFIAFEGAQLDPAFTLDKDEVIRNATARLKALKEHGVKTFVDPCPIELGRDVRMMAEISERAEMNIICTTGFYNEAHGLPHYWRVRSAEEIAALYIHELERGIGTTGIRPGAIKCGTGAPEISPLEKTFLEAAAIAQRATGAPIITHTDGGQCGPDQQCIFSDAGVPLHRCLIGHCCQNPDPDYHRGIADAGSYVGFDRIGSINFQSDDVRADNIATLVREGRGPRLLLSQDLVCHYYGNFMRRMSPDQLGKINQMRAAGKWPPPYTRVFTKFLPMLKERGVADSDIDMLFEDNPRRFFSGEIDSSYRKG